MKKDYIVFIFLLVLTTFEYFFRAEMLSWVIYLFAGLICLANRNAYRYKIFNRTTILYVTTFLSCYLIQVVFLSNFRFSSFVSRSITLIGPLLVAAIIEKRAVSIYVRVMYWISIISVVIYTLCFIPGIYDFFFNTIAQHFTSLNVENAVFEGGGRNIIIYNFLNGNTLDELGIHRNCGPFWEPGQFGVYLCIALFFNLFIEKQNLKYVNLLFIIALITTCSTGAYMGALVIFLMYAILRSRNIFLAILYFIIIFLLWQQVSDLEFLAAKISYQYESAEVGNDLSRFSAFITQIQMIMNSPLLGGEQISDYIDGDSETLASGTLLPFVILGIPFGIIYMMYICISCCGIAGTVNREKLVGVLFFILLLILSFSQTILMVPVIVTLVYVGMIRIANK